MEQVRRVEHGVGQQRFEPPVLVLQRLQPLGPQVIETPDGERYFTLSRTVRRVSDLQAGLEDALVVGLGCELKYAGKLVQARRLDIAAPAVVEIEPSCRICERPACPQRAAAPINRTLLIEETGKSLSPFIP